MEEKNLGCGSYRYVPTVKRMVSKAVEEAKSLGANGIISFEIKQILHDVKKNNSDMDTYLCYRNPGYIQEIVCAPLIGE